MKDFPRDLEYESLKSRKSNPWPFYTWILQYWQIRLVM